MREQENVEVALRATEAFNRRDRDAWLLLMDPEIEFTPPGSGLSPEPSEVAKRCGTAW
jgi:ketosteroid isomerase-like protein